MLKIKVFENAQSFFEKAFPADADIRVGRSEHCELVLRSKRVSREHCRLFFQNGFWQIEDLNSQNGIRVNDVKILSETLKNGDSVEVGDYRLEIFLQPEPSSALPDVNPDISPDDRTVLLDGGMASDKTIVRNINSFPDDEMPDNVIGKVFGPLFKNKRLLAAAIGSFLVLLIAIWVSTSSKETSDPEKVLLPAEQEKTKAMIDMETRNRLDAYLQSGQELFTAGNFNEALVRFQAVLNIDPNNATALEYAGMSRDKIRELEEQRRQAADEQKQRMERVQKIVSQARQAFQKSDYTGAMEIIAEADFLAPQEPSVTALKGEIATALENEKTRNEETLHQKEENLAKIKEHFENGQQFYDQKKYQEALQEWEQVLATGMDTPETAHVKHAIPHIKTLVEKDVRNDYEKGKSYFEKKDYTRAAAYLQKVSRVLPDFQDTEKLLTDALIELDAQAKKLYQEGLVYEGIGQNEKAAAKWREVLNIMPDENNEYYQRSLKKLQ